LYKFFGFLREYAQFRKIANSIDPRFPLRVKDLYPCLYDRTGSSDFDHHYVYHTSWAARLLAQTMPEVHIDIASDLRFATIVSAFIRVEYYDYRPAKLSLNNLSSHYADILSLPFPTGSVSSVSCMHVVEHIGLGRYGEPLDYDGDLKAISELKRVLREDGDLLFVVPVGAPRIRFNAHRIYSYEQILTYFSDLRLKEFTLITDNGSKGLVENASPMSANAQKYGCGCFWFTR
jgi:SAM-dependent methyltransferase